MRFHELLRENFKLVRPSHGYAVNAEFLIKEMPETLALFARTDDTFWAPSGSYVVVPTDGYEDFPKPYIILDPYNETAVIEDLYHGQLSGLVRYLIRLNPELSSYQTTYYGEGIALGDVAKITRQRTTGQVWYHGTTSLHLPKIMKLGLMPQDVESRNYKGFGGSEEGFVYVAADPNISRMHAENAAKHFGGAPVVLKINLTGLEANIVDDHDVSLTGAFKFNDTAMQRMRKRGESSLNVIGTAAYRGRIPPSRVEVAFVGKERGARKNQHPERQQFLTTIGKIARNLDEDEKTRFFKFINAAKSGGRFPDIYYTDPMKLVMSMYKKKTQASVYSAWIRGMLRRKKFMEIGGEAERILDAVKAEANRLSTLSDEDHNAFFS